MTAKEAGRKGGQATAAARRAAGIQSRAPYVRKRIGPTRPWHPPGPPREAVAWRVLPTIDRDELAGLEAVFAPTATHTSYVDRRYLRSVD